jgi:hypothetical protein
MAAAAAEQQGAAVNYGWAPFNTGSGPVSSVQGCLRWQTGTVGAWCMAAPCMVMAA